MAELGEKMSNNKDVLSMLQSRIALRANFLSAYNTTPEWPAVEDQKVDKKAIKEIVQLRRAQKALCKTLSNYSKNTRTEPAYGV